MEHYGCRCHPFCDLPWLQTYFQNLHLHLHRFHQLPPHGTFLSLLSYLTSFFLFSCRSHSLNGTMSPPLLIIRSPLSHHRYLLSLDQGLHILDQVLLLPRHCIPTHDLKLKHHSSSPPTKAIAHVISPSFLSLEAFTDLSKSTTT